jgi:hypothetical protein
MYPASGNMTFYMLLTNPHGMLGKSRYRPDWRRKNNKMGIGYIYELNWFIKR